MWLKERVIHFFVADKVKVKHGINNVNSICYFLFSA